MTSHGAGPPGSHRALPQSTVLHAPALIMLIRRGAGSGCRQAPTHGIHLGGAVVGDDRESQ